MPMNLNNLLHINDAPNYTPPFNSTIIRLREGIFSKKVSVLKGTAIYDELVTVDLIAEMQDSAFLILSEPANSTLAEDELHEAKNALEILGGKIEKVEEIVLPDSDNKRKIIVIEAVKHFDKKYPRKAGVPTVSPL